MEKMECVMSVKDICKMQYQVRPRGKFSIYLSRMEPVMSEINERFERGVRIAQLIVIVSG